ncbi:hypothetical protein NL676_010800 [Syzygium grande]|nr:hypothetical protein NL676_010800 [Syzygium grande]
MAKEALVAGGLKGEAGWWRRERQPTGKMAQAWGAVGAPGKRKNGEGGGRWRPEGDTTASLVVCHGGRPIMGKRRAATDTMASRRRGKMGCCFVRTKGHGRISAARLNGGDGRV